MAQERAQKKYTFNLKNMSIGDFINACEKTASSFTRDKVAVLKIAHECSDDTIMDEPLSAMDEILRQFSAALNAYDPEDDE